ncbi:MAG TPA: VOC family protein [Lactobacillaceae bacterium]
MNEKITLGPVALRVRDLAAMARYYQEAFGFVILAQTARQIVLGQRLDRAPLLILEAQPDAPYDPRSAGLFHTAFLLPTRKDLGLMLRRLLQLGVPIGGASDHGFSEALYLQDPEGNGIEIYQDRAKDKWERDGDKILGKTEEIDALGLMRLANDEDLPELPRVTKIGHVHLQAVNVAKSQAWYMQLFAGLGVKDDHIPNATFVAWGDYHHHLAFNSWNGPLAARTDQLGLAYYTLYVTDGVQLAELAARAEAMGATYYWEDESLYLIDPSGIQIVIQQKNDQ